MMYKSKGNDELAVMMERCKCVKEGELPFVCSVQAAPQPLCVLATETQLKQLQLCCTDVNDFSILSVDPTFNLGPFYVTPIVFLHKIVLNKRTQKHPVFLGPILFHQRMNTETYSYFAHQIQILRPVYATFKQLTQTGNKLSSVVLEMLFPIPFLRCFKHFLDNCVTKLRDLNFDSAALQEIVPDIVGVEGSDERQLGLVDSVDLSKL